MPSLGQVFAKTHVCQFFFSISHDPTPLMFKQVILHKLKHISLPSKESFFIWFTELVSLINTITNLFDIPGDKNKKKSH